MQYSEEVKQTVIRLLYEQSKEDGFLHPFEMRFIYKVAADFQIEEEKLKALLLKIGDVKIVLPKDEQSRMQILYRLLFLMKFDQDVSDMEINYLRSLSLKLGLRRDMITELATEMKNHIGTAVPPNLLLSIIKKYLN